MPNECPIGEIYAEERDFQAQNKTLMFFASPLPKLSWYKTMSSVFISEFNRELDLKVFPSYVLKTLSSSLTSVTLKLHSGHLRD